MTTKTRKQINIRVTEEEYKKIAEKADIEGTSISDLMKKNLSNLSATQVLQSEVDLLQGATKKLEEEKEELEKKVENLLIELGKKEVATQTLQDEVSSLQSATTLLQKDLEEIYDLKSNAVVLETKIEALTEKNDLLMAQLDEKRAEISDLKNDKTELYRLFDQQQQLIHGNKFALPAPKKSFWARLLGR